MNDKEKSALIKKAVAIAVAFPVSVALVSLLVMLPGQLFKRRAHKIRAQFCERLIRGDKEGALKLIPSNVNGHDRLKRFVNLPWKDIECGDAGKPELGSPVTCVNWNQRVDVKPKNIADLGPEVLEGRITFQYSCNMFADWIDVAWVSPHVHKNLKYGDSYSGWDPLNAEPPNHSLDRPAATRWGNR